MSSFTEHFVAETAKKKAATTAKRLATRIQNGTTKYGKRSKKQGKPIVFYASLEIDRQWFNDDHHFWSARYFVHTVRWREITWRSNGEGFSHLKYEYLEKVISRPVLKKVKQTLIDHKVIACDGCYKPGEKSLGYKLLDGFRETKAFVCTDNKINKRIWALMDREERKLLPVHKWLRDKFSLLHFDMDKAKPIINRLRPHKRVTNPEQLLEHRKKRAAYSQNLADKQWTFTRDDYGRVHTLITSLEGVLLSCLSVDQKPLFELDIKNSQPLMFGKLAENFLSCSKVTQNTLINKEFSSSSNPYQSFNQTININNKSNKRITNVIGIVTPCEEKELGKAAAFTLPDDLLNSIRICEAGEFYESLMTEEEKAKGNKVRRRIKVRFYLVLFGENKERKGKKAQDIWDRFVKKHPTMAAVLKRLKKKNYKHSSHLLQNFESTLFIHRICRAIWEEFPDAPVFTRHDSILTTADFVVAIKDIIIREFAKVDLVPSIAMKEHK